MVEIDPDAIPYEVEVTLTVKARVLVSHLADPDAAQEHAKRIVLRASPNFCNAWGVKLKETDIDATAPRELTPDEARQLSRSGI